MVLVYAHRGFARKYPESTAPALRGALDAGAGGIELDVRLTRDGTAVVVHDDTVDRTSNGSARVDQLDLAQIKALDAGSWFDRAFAGERFLTFEEALKLVEDSVRLNVHLKDSGDTRPLLVEEVVRLVDRYRLFESVFLSAGDAALKLACQMEPRIQGCFLGPQPRNTLSHIEVSRHLGCLILQIPHQQVNAPFVDRAHAASMEVNALHLIGDTPADVAELRRLVECGIDGLIVDDLPEAVAVANGQPLP